MDSVSGNPGQEIKTGRAENGRILSNQYLIIGNPGKSVRKGK